MKKKIYFISLILIILVSITSPVVANESKSVIKWDSTIELPVKSQTNPGMPLSGIDKIVDSGVIVINGIENPLYVTFENPDSAIKDLKKKIPEFLEVLQKEYYLNELNDENWKDYRYAMHRYIEWPDENKKFQNSDSLKVLECFFDIYENDECNKEILSYTSGRKSIKLVSDELDLVLLLPSFAPYSTNYEKYYRAPKNTSKGLNNTRGIQYATQYAINHNWPTYEIFSADCTNFVSQILEYAGQSQYVYSSPSSGWWHKRTLYADGTYGHSHSYTWIRADTFTKYWGTTYTTSGIWYLSLNVRPGDFLALDKTFDGSWDHTGYCTQRDSYYANYSGYQYYDFKIAQHSTNYHLWVSGTSNSWETYDKLPTYACRYAYLRWY